MASVAQIQANRLNAQKSTGPRTAAGKERACRNAIKHGLLAREAVIQGEDPEEFELHREGMLEELAPAGAVEAMLAERVVGLSWQLRRAERLQNAAFAALDDCEPTSLLDARLEEWKQIKGSQWDRGISGVFDEDAALGKVVVADFAEARVLDRMLMYERRIESSLYRTMAELRREREAREAAKAEQVPHSGSSLPTGQEAAAPAKLASFGTNVAEEAASAKREARNAMCQVSSDGSDFTVQASHFELQEKIKRDGATTNPTAGNHGRDARATIPSFHRSSPIPDAPAEELSCETNPISGGVSSWARHGASEELQGSVDFRPASTGHTQVPME